MKETPDGHEDAVLIPQAMKAMGEVLSKMNEASGITSNKIKLSQLHQQIQSDAIVSSTMYIRNCLALTSFIM